MQPAIHAEKLERTFEDVLAVAGVDLEVPPGEIYGFLGPNGAGKTTTLRMLCTLLAPTGGRAWVAGHDVAREPEAVRLRIGVALQDAALDEKQTGLELLRLQGRLYGLTRKQIDARLADLAALVDIGDSLGRQIGTYSGGMKRRLDLASALIHNPEVLFLDEPTTGLDPAVRARVWEEVRRLNAELGMTIFLTTQYLEEADVLADRVGILAKGSIVAEGTPEELKRTIGVDVIVATIDTSIDGSLDVAAEAVGRVPGVDSVEGHDQELTIASAAGAQAISPVAIALSEAGVPVREISLRTPTLDDVFLHLTGEHIQSTHSDGESER